MDPFANWETTSLNDPFYVESGHAEDLPVFLPNREELLPINLFLERTAVVMTGPHQFDQLLAHRLSLKLANHFRGHPRDFQVSKVHPGIGDCIVVFPNTPMRDKAVQICAFALGQGTHAQLTEWTKDMGLVYDPALTVARIKLHGVPLQFWNNQDVATLVSGFGELKRVAPFFADGNCEFIRALVECRSPLVPRNLLTSIGTHSVSIQVELDGWVHATDIGQHLTSQGGRSQSGGSREDDGRTTRTQQPTTGHTRYRSRETQEEFDIL